MKPILIDSIRDEFGSTEQFNVDIDGQKMKGWQIAKPMNYDPEYFSMEDRQEMANAILEGKAIAVCFFEDLSNKEQAEYVKHKMNRESNLADQLLD